MMDTSQQLPQPDDIVQLSDEDLRLAISQIVEIDKLKSKQQSNYKKMLE